MASFRESVSVLSLVTPRRLRFGSGGNGRCVVSVKMGSRGSVPDGEGDAFGSAGGVGDGTGTPVVGTVGCVPVGGTVVVPGGVCAAGRCVPGAAVGLVGR